MEVIYKNTKYKVQLGIGQGLTKGVAILGGISILTFLLTQSNRDMFYPLFGFIPSYAIGKLMIWQFITANFIHGNLTHLLFNMIGLYMFGCPVEKKVGQKEFIKYFLVCGIGGYILAFILWAIGITPNNLIVGASAGVYGLLLAFSLLYPNQKILLFFVIPMQAKWIALIFGGLEFLLMFRNDGISHIGHLGGILTGFGYILYQKGYALRKKTANLRGNV
jgi:membrane associated rhomboid family serine protease